VLRKRGVIGFTLVELLVVIVVVAILAAAAVPVFNIVRTKGYQSKDCSDARSIGLALRLYAEDNKGVFPKSTTSANAAFLDIVPNYVSTQKIFFVAGSGWSTGSYAVEMSPSGTMVAGQNAYAYVSGLSDTNNGNYPLIADGFNEGAPGVYNSIQGTKGGVWKGTKAIVVRVDDSATVEPVEDSDYRVPSNRMNADSGGADIFTTGATWMPSGTVLNPE